MKYFWVLVSTLPFFPSFDFLHTYLKKLRLIQNLKEGLAFQLKKMSWHFTNSGLLYYRYKKTYKVSEMKSQEQTYV